jgi:hypothetical protein
MVEDTIQLTAEDCRQALLLCNLCDEMVWLSTPENAQNLHEHHREWLGTLGYDQIPSPTGTAGYGKLLFSWLCSVFSALALPDQAALVAQAIK